MKEKPYSIIVMGVVLFVFLVAFLLFAWLRFEAPFVNRPEQCEQAEVISKRIREYHDGDGMVRDLFVTFKFLNNSTKEFRVDIKGKYYNDIHEGDIGILVYKERKDNETKYSNEEIRYKGRRFVSFEENVEYGKAKIEASRQQDVVVVCIFTATIMSNIILCFVFYKRNIYILVKNSPEQHEKAEVIKKRIKEDNSGDGPTAYYYFITFKFPDDSVKEFNVGIDKRDDYDALRKGFAGILTYKERKNIEEKIKKEEKRYKGRLFINFEKDVPQKSFE